MNRTGAFAACLLLVASGLGAQETQPPRLALNSSYSFTAWEGSGVDWQGQQSATLGLVGRWGSSLLLEGQLVAPFERSSLVADDLLKQLALTWNLNSWSVVTFGKQRLKWGSAKVFSAVDGLEPAYDPLHPRAARDGVTGVKAEFLPNDWLSLAALALPTATLTDSKLAARADILWDEWDLSAGVIRSVDVGGRHASVYADFARFFERFSSRW